MGGHLLIIPSAVFFTVLVVYEMLWPTRDRYVFESTPKRRCFAQ